MEKRQMVNSSYEELKSITDQYYKTGIEPEYGLFISILEKHGIKLRNKDGQDHHATWSVPKSLSNALLLGIRYKKQNGTWTEDHFLFVKGKSIVAYYKGKVEKVLPEYKGSHKKQQGF